MWRAALVFLLGLVALVPVTVSANHDGTWHPGDGPPGVGEGTGSGSGQFLMAVEDVFGDPGLQINVVFQVNPEGDTSAHGTVRIRDVAANATKVFHATSGEETTAACADADDNGRTGLLFLTGGFVANDGAELHLSFTPTAGEIDEGGEHPGIVIITDDSGSAHEFEGAILVVSAADGPMR